MKKRVSLNKNLMRLLPLLSLGLILCFFLPWVNIDLSLSPESYTVYTGFKLLAAKEPLLNVKTLLICAVAALITAVLQFLKPNKKLVLLHSITLIASVILSVKFVLTAKETADATGLIENGFMIKSLSMGLWLFQIIALAALFMSLSAMHEPVEYIVLTIMASIWLLPIIWLLLTAFRLEPGAYTPYLLPKNYTFDNFSRLFTETQQFNFPRWYMNTLIVAVITCLLTTCMVLMIAFTFSRLRFPSRKTFMNIGLILGMFPGFMSMIAVYHILKAIGLSKSLVSLVLVYTGGGVLNYFIAKGFFDTIPKSLDEAATLDGANKKTIFWKIILPSSKPIVVYTAITAFIAPWVDFIFVSVIMKDDYQNYTVALGLFKMLEREHIYQYFTRFCAGAVIVAIPITLLFIKIQKFYVAGVVGGAVKG